MTYDADVRKEFLKTESPRGLMLLTALTALIYFTVLVAYFPVGNTLLFYLLVVGEVFHLWQVYTFIYTVWDTTYMPARNDTLTVPVDVFITVAGEPVELVAETVAAAKRMDYPAFAIHILNDGYVAKKDNWRDIEALASRMDVHCITRTVAGGAKAGNINNALRLTTLPLIAIFDADHVPHRDFLRKTVGYFANERVGFVQTPQFYKNYGENFLTRSTWEQQELFFGPICKGKNRLNAATMCGTNMVISRKALNEVGGMCTDSIAEDFVTGLFMHARGWKSVYVPEVLAEGLATEDLLSYTKQQFRWARGALDVLFRYNPLRYRGLTWAQRIQYIASASFYVSGLVVLFDILLPLVFFYTGAVPVLAPGMLLAAVFLPYMFCTLYTIQRTSNFTFTFQSLGFSMGAWHIHLRALWAAVRGERSAFQITQKGGRATGQALSLVAWHCLYILATLVGIVVALMREGFSASLINNSAWALLNIAVFAPIIWAALPAQTTFVRSIAYRRASKKVYDVQ